VAQWTLPRLVSFQNSTRAPPDAGLFLLVLVAAMPRIEWCKKEGRECTAAPALDLRPITSNVGASNGGDGASGDDASHKACTCGGATPCGASPSAGGPSRDGGRGPSVLLPA
jgi:hypothetical protein